MLLDRLRSSVRNLYLLISGRQRYESDKHCSAIEAFPVDRQSRTRSQQRCGRLSSRDRTEADTLVVYIDGIQFGIIYHVIGAMGVDSSGHKHVLGLREEATENVEVATALLEELAGRGLDVFFSTTAMTIPRRQKIDTPHFWSCSCQNFKWFAPQPMYRLANRRCLTSADRWSDCSTLMGSSWR